MTDPAKNGVTITATERGIAIDRRGQPLTPAPAPVANPASAATPEAAVPSPNAPKAAGETTPRR